MKVPLICPKNTRHNAFTAYVMLRGDVKVDRNGEILNLEEALGCDLPIVKFKPDLCAECKTPLVDGPTWHKQETREELQKRVIMELGLDEEESKNFDLESYRCGLCQNFYDKCDCAETGLR